MNTVTKAWKPAFILLAVAVISMSGGWEASASGVHVLDHYKIYNFDPTLSIKEEGMFLFDQFSGYEINVSGPLRLGVPTDKNEGGIRNPVSHLTWYWINNAELQPTRQVVYENQFGEGILQTGQLTWLLAPALKNAASGSEPPQDLSHFTCYDASGDPLLVNVVMNNQFGTETNVLLHPDLFCNPTKKDHNGIVYPIVNDLEHLVCYEFQNTDPNSAPEVELIDQIQPTTGSPLTASWLCVPSFKTGVTQNENSTWGKMKSMYR